jgi:hypothetical protein
MRVARDGPEAADMPNFFIFNVDGSLSDCGFDRWMQQTRDCASRGSVANEAKTSDLLHRKPEGTDVGALAER